MAKAPIRKQPKSGFIENVSKLSLAAKAAIFLFTILIVGGAFYGLALMPYQQESKSLNSAISNAKKDIKAQEDALKLHKDVADVSPFIDGAYQYIQQYLPQENEMSQLVQMVAKIGSRAGLTDGVTLFAPKLPAEVKENYAEIPFTMNLQGEFKAVLSFLYDFSRMNRIVNITQVSISQPKMVDPQREILHISVRCSGSTYRTLTVAEMTGPKDDGKRRRGRK